MRDGYDQVTDVLSSGYHVLHQVHRELDRSGDVENGQGISLASRWPLGRAEEIDLQVTPRTADFACGALLAEVLAPEPIGRLLFVNHLPSWQSPLERERELQTVRVAEAVESWVRDRPAHVVLAGDLDAEESAASIRFLAGLQSLSGTSVCYRDAWEHTHRGEAGPTFTARNPHVAAGNRDRALELGRRIDHVFVRCTELGPTLDIASCDRIFDEPVGGVWASDHFGVSAELTPQMRDGGSGR